MTKREILEDIKLVEDQRKKASRKAIAAADPRLREAWERVALALRHGAEALRREAEGQ